jgi:hypothetical protein
MLCVLEISIKRKRLVYPGMKFILTTQKEIAEYKNILKAGETNAIE